MQQTTTARRQSVLTFDRDGFESACAALMQRVAADRRPDVLIGIRSAGLFVAEAMAKAAGGAIPILAITCRRPSSAHKAKLAAARTVIGRLPRPLLDQLRLIEHKMLTRRPPAAANAPSSLDEEELAALEAWVARTGDAPFPLIVDDAVDSGVTLSLVLDAVRQRLPPRALLRSAAITVTTPRPLATPDYALYRRQLCRFPWSLDAPAKSPS
jgi:hypoxanthine phosphoribosyltransferase